MRLKVLKHPSACRSGTPSCWQVTDPLIRAALTENMTHDTARIARLCDSDVQTQELLTPDKHTQRKECFYSFFFSEVAGLTHSAASHP